MSPLQWRECTPADRAALHAFRCVHPSSRVHGHRYRRHQPRPWEEDVQKKIHNVTPTCGYDAAVLLGEDANGLAAVAIAGIQESPEFVVIEGVAVASRCRGSNGSQANEAVERAIDWAIGQADVAGLERVLITAKSDPRNVLAARLMRRHGFAVYQRTELAEEWIQRFMIVRD